LLTTSEKVSLLRAHREEQYNQLIDAVYDRRGWTENGVPRLEKLKALGLDLPAVIEVVKPHQ
jgi:aldehyde:ferredoxin oxidoreductase